MDSARFFPAVGSLNQPQIHVTEEVITEEAQQLADAVQKRAELELKFKSEFVFSDNLLKLRETVKSVFDWVLDIADYVQTAVEAITDFKDVTNATGSAGASIGFAGLNELTSGLDYLCMIKQVRNMKHQRAVLQNKIRAYNSSEVKKNPEILEIWKAEKVRFDKEIRKQELKFKSKKRTFIITHTENCVKLFTKGLSISSDVTSRIMGATGGVIFGTIGMVKSFVGLRKNVQEYDEANSLIHKISAVDPKGETKLIEAINLVKEAAIDHTVNHKKTQIKLSVFQNAFSACSGALAIAGAVLGIIAITGATLSAAGLAFTGIGLPVVTAVGILIAGGIAIYTHRQTIARALKGFFRPREESERGRFNLERNLSFRAWRVQRRLSKTTNELNKLALNRVSLIETKDDSKTAEINELGLQILKLSGEQIRLAQEVDEIKYKRASQSLRDATTPLIENPKRSVDALIEVIDSLTQDELNQFVDFCKKTFTGVKLDKFEIKRDRHLYVKTQIQMAILKESLF